MRASSPDGRLDLRRVMPSARLAAHVHHFWSVRWSLRSPFCAETLPHPTVQIMHTNTDGERYAQILGVPTGRLARCLTGEGEAFGVTFRPAMFQPLLGASMASLTGRVVTVEKMLGARAERWSEALEEAHEVGDKVALTESFFAPLLPAPEPLLERLRDVVERMARDRSLRYVEDVAAASGFDTRSLQRYFRRYVGVSPKWVLQRYRLHEALVQLTETRPPGLAAVAASLGYADQAHFSRDFRRITGQSPRSFEGVAEATRKG